MDPLRYFYAFHEQNTFRHIVVATHSRQPQAGQRCPLTSELSMTSR
jgi:hypothetical protein